MMRSAPTAGFVDREADRQTGGCVDQKGRLAKRCRAGVGQRPGERGNHRPDGGPGHFSERDVSGGEHLSDQEGELVGRPLDHSGSQRWRSPAVS